MIQLGASLPVGDIGTGPAVIRDYAQAAEGLGYDYLVAPDHVIGGNPNSPGDGRRIGTTETAYHDPFVLFAFLAGVTRKVGFAAGVLILAQRQAALVAKQAASLDALCEGRFRLGVGVGWNEIEFQGLGMDFHTRGVRSEEQVRFMQALWKDQHVTFKGKYHQLDDGGINPRPKSGKVPIWFGGHAEATFRRTAKYGDGFMPLAWPAGDEALKAFDKLRALIRAEGRDPAEVGMEVWVSPGVGNEDDWRREMGFWKAAGITHANVHTSFVSAHHRRIAGRTYDDHLTAITRYRAAVADLL
ncbi:MAG: LLM class F420-dependent oxidoreductase [Reyranellaceae bacterium]